MSPRRNRQNRVKPAPGTADERHGVERQETWGDQEWVMRPVAGGTGKSYRCPGCDQEIPPGVGHVVAWPEHHGVDERRHWHRPCWNARDRRSAKLQRSRNAPRY